MADATQENTLNQLFSRIAALETENSDLKQQLVVFKAENGENEMVRILEELQGQRESRNEASAKKLNDWEQFFRENKQKLTDKEAQVGRLEKAVKQMTYALEEKDREIARLKTQLEGLGMPLEELNPEAAVLLGKILEQKVFGKRMECPSCPEPDGTPPLLFNLWICPEHFEQQYGKKIDEVALEELDKLAEKIAICGNCIQHSHQECQRGRPNLLSLKKRFIGEQLSSFLDTVKCQERVGKQYPKMSTVSAEERIRKRIDAIVTTPNLKTKDFDEQVEKLIDSMQRFGHATAEIEAKMAETMRKMIAIENEQQ